MRYSSGIVKAVKNASRVLYKDVLLILKKRCNDVKRKRHNDVKTSLERYEITLNNVFCSLQNNIFMTI